MIKNCLLLNIIRNKNVLVKKVTRDCLNIVPAINRNSFRAMSCADQYTKFALPERLLGLDKNVWVEYIKLVNEYKPINLGQGFPDYAPPQHVTDALKEVSDSCNILIHQYARSAGNMRLVNALSKLYSGLIGHNIDPMTEILIGIGATQILFNVFLGHLQPGDEAIIIEPFFDCYLPMIKLTGAKLHCIPLEPRKGMKVTCTRDWILDPDRLEKLFNEKTKMIVVNTPHNPIGKVYTVEELTMIGDLCKKWNVLCVADEVYEWMVYKPNKHIRMASLPGMWERTITIGSAGKSFSVTGWKTGWAYGPKELIKNLQTVHQNCVYACVSIVQEAIAIALEKELEVLGTPECSFEKMRAELEPKRDFVVKELTDMGMNPIIPEGGYFVVADFTPLLPKIDLSEEKDKEKDYKFTKWMAKKVGVLAIPPSAFYSDEHKHLGENYARFCFIKEDHNLQLAAERLRAWKENN
ncbi:UNVERIFIED_CONTAM: hypothetical protein PYX00_003836 [Menopon gallinae]|uniref:Aminotransferase class I/classII large domain-containing protein n=1 Tax=Menopon gallinae TaxID=328185 RepID=A0AAW2I1X4_9NEOP